MQAALPNAVGIFRTQSHPMPKDCDSGENNNTELGKKAHIVQLNAAGRYVASEHHWWASYHLLRFVLCWRCAV